MRLRAAVLRPDHGWMAAIAALVLLAIWPWFAGDGAALPQLPPPPPSGGGALPSLPPLASFAAIAERPLFSPSRRPSMTDRGSAAAALAGRYRLLGLVTTRDGRRALMADGSRTVELGEGDAVEGWSIKRIEQDRLVLSSPAGEAVLTLRQAAAASASAAGSAATPAARGRINP
ncbi:MAG: hypothetical protein JO267_14665 [Alphaproteobacteria bacterium]|nr:hypothetical protein [Alphaproteobacteria bacterium]